jgi:mono/diheme cytochrome c family protein
MNRTFKLQLTAFALVALSGCAASGAASSAVGELNGKPVDAQQVALGEKVWTNKACHACHTFGGRLGGPDLAGVMERRDHDWLRKWLKETETMLQGDPQAVAMAKDWDGKRMPNMKLTDQQIEALFHYMAQKTAEVNAARGSN